MGKIERDPYWYYSNVITPAEVKICPNQPIDKKNKSTDSNKGAKAPKVRKNAKSQE